ncbi:MAG: hypothetical protein GHCLOJNM_03203 [bacterium]|nr:hypothetical protein [bacterium]
MGVVINSEAYLFGLGDHISPLLREVEAAIQILPEGPAPCVSRTPTPRSSTTHTATLSETPTRTLRNTRTPTPTPSPTETLAPCDDIGYYLLTSFGEHIPVGHPPDISGSAITPGRKLFGDMELASSSGGNPDLAILDHFGVVRFIADPPSSPPQSFAFPAGNTPCGPAVDLVMSADSLSFWVLTEGGGIFRGGNADPGDPQLGNDADDLCDMLPIPFGPMRGSRFTDPNDGATIRAVGLVVIESGNNAMPHGFILMDSQGGTYVFDGEGNSIRDSHGGRGIGASSEQLLDPNLPFPFFPGLDIARDIEVHPIGNPPTSLVVLDGWGGIHPVPARQESYVRFLRNETAVDSHIPLTTVGMPYVTVGFDDPETVPNEAESSADVNSIFVDIEFCRTGDGIYTLDKFGGVYTFGSSRASPSYSGPPFGRSPYFYPFFWMEDIEPVR